MKIVPNIYMPKIGDHFTLLHANNNSRIYTLIEIKDNFNKTHIFQTVDCMSTMSVPGISVREQMGVSILLLR